MTETLLLLAFLLALGAAQALGLTHDSRDPDWTLRPRPDHSPNAGCGVR